MTLSTKKTHKVLYTHELVLHKTKKINKDLNILKHIRKTWSIINQEIHGKLNQKTWKHSWKTKS